MWESSLLNTYSPVYPTLSLALLTHLLWIEEAAGATAWRRALILAQAQLNTASQRTSQTPHGLWWKKQRPKLKIVK